jgi:hypothetical protein
MKNSFLKTEEKHNFLGKKDKLFNYKSKWPIYILDAYDKNGLWEKIQNKLDLIMGLLIGLTGIYIY